MARTRSIKPAFFSNEILAELPAETRLLFIALWTMADRDGRMEDRPKRIKAEAFPYDNFDVNNMLSQLHLSGFVVRYSVSGHNYIQINNFVRHQNPHPKEQSNNYPEPPEAAENLDAIYLHGNAAKLNDESSLLPITYYPLPSTLLPITQSLEEKVPKGTKKKNGVEKPSDVSETIWLDFINHRKAKKAPVSETVINSIRKEADKIPWSMDQALSEICARGWQGFKADWILRDKDGGKMSQNMKNLKDIYENGW